MQYSKLFSVAIISSIFTFLPAHSEEITPQVFTQEKDDDTPKIKIAQSKLDISEELKEDITETIQRYYIIFHEQIWGNLPKGKIEKKLYRLDKDENKTDFHIGSIYDNNTLAIISKLKNTDKEHNKDINDLIKNTLYYGILPSFYEEGISLKEINEISRINITKPYNHSDIKKTKVIFRDKTIESYYIIEKNKDYSNVKIFSISKIK